MYKNVLFATGTGIITLLIANYLSHTFALIKWDFLAGMLTGSTTFLFSYHRSWNHKFNEKGSDEQGADFVAPMDGARISSPESAQK